MGKGNWRPTPSRLNLLLERGFSLQHLEEWGPSPEQVAEHPEWADERERPMFLLVSARC